MCEAKREGEEEAKRTEDYQEMQQKLANSVQVLLTGNRTQIACQLLSNFNSTFQTGTMSLLKRNS